MTRPQTGGKIYTLTIILFPLATSADNDTLIRTAPAALWIALLLPDSKTQGWGRGGWCGRFTAK